MESLKIIEKRLVNSTSIETINLCNRNLKELPQLIIEAKGINDLKYLYLDNNELIFVPEIGRFSQLEELTLENNRLTLIPDTYCNLKNLKSLNLSKNSFKMIGQNLFKNLKYLNILWLNSCELMCLPNEICSLMWLEKLGLISNSLTHLPSQFGQLKNLKWLNLKQNKLDNLPETFQNLKMLAYLNLSENKFTKNPKVTHELVNLNVLNLSNNLINTFSEDDIVGLANLTTIDLRLNPFLDSTKLPFRNDNSKLFKQLSHVKSFIINEPSPIEIENGTCN
jgi:Leucine-rich repeat (LRR) protein